MTLAEVVQKAHGLSKHKKILKRQDDLFSAIGMCFPPPGWKGEGSDLAVNLVESQKSSSVADNCVYAMVCASLKSRKGDKKSIALYHNRGQDISQYPRNLKEVVERYGIFSYVMEYEGPGVQNTYKIICYAKNLEGVRFGICKELMHIYTDTVKDSTTDLVDALDADDDEGYEAFLRCINSYLLAINDWQYNVPQGKDAELPDETACFYMAAEVMVPWTLRGRFAECHATKNVGADDVWLDDELTKAAHRFLIPREVVEHITRRVFVRGKQRYSITPYCQVSADVSRK